MVYWTHFSGGERLGQLIIAIDLGGTRLRVGLLDTDGEILARHEEPTRAEEGPDRVVERLTAVVRWMGEKTGWDGVKSVGVSAPGPLDPWRGVILWAPNLPGWRDVPLADGISEALQRPVFMGNDGNLAALAEHRRGAGQGRGDLIYITVSTGIGGGVISEGQLVLGHAGLGGELGHMTLEARGPRCSCGNVGCLEALASGTAIARQARDLVSAGVRTQIADLAGDDREAITARLVHQAARGGDVVAIGLLRKAGVYLGIGIVNLMYLFNPSAVVIGGGVSKTGDLLLVPMQATVRERIHEVFWRDCPIMPAELGDDAGLVGAAILAMEGGQV